MIRRVRLIWIGAATILGLLVAALAFAAGRVSTFGPQGQGGLPADHGAGMGPGRFGPSGMGHAGYAAPGMNHGFALFGFVVGWLLFLLVVGLIVLLIVNLSRRRGSGGWGGPGAWNGPQGMAGRFEEWHRQAHAASPQGPATTPPPSKQAPPEDPTSQPPGA